jgi:hypothetical protein
MKQLIAFRILALAVVIVIAVLLSSCSRGPYASAARKAGRGCPSWYVKG